MGKKRLFIILICTLLLCACSVKTIDNSSSINETPGEAGRHDEHDNEAVSTYEMPESSHLYKQMNELIAVPLTEYYDGFALQNGAYTLNWNSESMAIHGSNGKTEVPYLQYILEQLTPKEKFYEGFRLSGEHIYAYQLPGKICFLFQTDGTLSISAVFVLGIDLETKAPYGLEYDIGSELLNAKALNDKFYVLGYIHANAGPPVSKPTLLVAKLEDLSQIYYEEIDAIPYDFEIIEGTVRLFYNPTDEENELSIQIIFLTGLNHHRINRVYKYVPLIDAAGTTAPVQVRDGDSFMGLTISSSWDGYNRETDTATWYTEHFENEELLGFSHHVQFDGQIVLKGVYYDRTYAPSYFLVDESSRIKFPAFCYGQQPYHAGFETKISEDLLKEAGLWQDSNEYEVRCTVTIDKLLLRAFYESGAGPTAEVLSVSKT